MSPMTMYDWSYKAKLGNQRYVLHLQVDAGTYESMLARPNTNRSEEDTIEARSVGEALSALEIDSEEKDAHPER